MPVEIYIRNEPEYTHERAALLKLAQSMRHAFAVSEQTYLLAANVEFWGIQADALVLAPHAIVLIELKSCLDPIQGDANSPWQTVPGGEIIHGGSHVNPYQQVVAARGMLIKYLDRNRRRFLNSTRAKETAGRWGHISAAIAFSPFRHPNSEIVTPPESRAWLGVIGLNEVADFLFTRVSPQFDLRPQELRRLVKTLRCTAWTEIEAHIPPVVSYGHLWLLDGAGNRSYTFPIVDAATIGRSHDRSLVVPKQFRHTSRHHAYLRIVGDIVWLHDDSSTYGTFVNGQPVLEEGKPLEDGDRIWLGDVGHTETCQLDCDRRTHLNRTADPTSTTR